MKTKKGDNLSWTTINNKDTFTLYGYSNYNLAEKDDLYLSWAEGKLVKRSKLPCVEQNDNPLAPQDFINTLYCSALGYNNCIYIHEGPFCKKQFTIDIHFVTDGKVINT